MIWLTDRLTGRPWGANPTEIHSIHPRRIEDPRTDAPNVETSEYYPHERFARGSVVNMAGEHTDVHVVDENPAQIRQLIEDHEERFTEAFEAMRLARESQQE